jgi:hypothetical protein
MRDFNEPDFFVASVTWTGRLHLSPFISAHRTQYFTLLFGLCPQHLLKLPNDSGCALSCSQSGDWPSWFKAVASPPFPMFSTTFMHTPLTHLQSTDVFWIHQLCSRSYHLQAPFAAISLPSLYSFPLHHSLGHPWLSSTSPFRIVAVSFSPRRIQPGILFLPRSLLDS